MIKRPRLKERKREREGGRKGENVNSFLRGQREVTQLGKSGLVSDLLGQHSWGGIRAGH